MIIDSELKQLNSRELAILCLRRLDRIDYRINCLIDIMTTQFKAEVMELNNFHAIEQAEALKTAYDIRAEFRQEQVEAFLDKWLQAHRNEMENS